SSNHMSLKAKFSDAFRPKIRDRGHAYFRSARVKILNHSDSHVDASVTGGSNYRVKLTLRRTTLDITCTCPYFERGEECKHVWATMLAADSHQYLSSVDLLPKLQLRYDEDEAIPLRELAKIDNSSQHKLPKLSPWRQQLSSLTSRSLDTPRLNSKTWSTNREIFYVIDPDSGSF